MPRHSSRSTSEGEKSRWRKAQERRRRARLSRRGRATLALLAVASLGGIALAAGLPSESEVAGFEGVEPVEAPPAVPRLASDAPAELLERLICCTVRDYYGILGHQSLSSRISTILMQTGFPPITSSPSMSFSAAVTFFCLVG